MRPSGNLGGTAEAYAFVPYADNVCGAGAFFMCRTMDGI